jgi:chemotaxis protein MotB
MPPEIANDDSEQMGGTAPLWMVTYGDSVTLLLTFFVMLLTFSTPNKEGMAQLAKGMLAGSRRMALFSGATQEESLVPDERTTAESRLDESGGESPPMGSDAPLDELTRHFESTDVSKLKELEGGRLIRIPVVDLFGTGTELTDEGRRVLDQVVKVVRAKRYSIIVRVHAGVGSTPQDRQERSLRMGIGVSGYLRQKAGKACEDIGVSDNVDLLGAPASPGTCEIFMLEV